MGYETRNVDLTAGNSPEHCFKIALFGPANEANRVIVTTQLIFRIISARAIRA